MRTKVSLNVGIWGGAVGYMEETWSWSWSWSAPNHLHL